MSTVAFGLLDRVAPAGTATEATSWIITSYQAGLAAGTGLGGAIVQGAGTTPAFVAAIAFAVLAAAVAYTRRRSLDRA